MISDSQDCKLRDKRKTPQSTLQGIFENDLLENGSSSSNKVTS